MIAKIEPCVFNSDVLNDEYHIYFLSPHRRLFELVRYPLFDNVPIIESVFEARKVILNKYGVFPKVVFVPFSRADDGKLPYICDSHGIQVVYMTSDGMKEHVKVLKEEVLIM